MGRFYTVENTDSEFYLEMVEMCAETGDDSSMEEFMETYSACAELLGAGVTPW